MSGGVGPTIDGISFHDAQPETDRKLLHDDPKAAAAAAVAAPPSRILSFRQLNSLAVITVLSASGMVGGEDLAFAFFSLAYIYFLSAAAFPTTTTSPSPVFNPRPRLLTTWMAAGALVGLVLPVAYILEGVFEGDKEGIRAAAPHVFLLACQVFAEGITFNRGFSLPMRAFVPVFFNAKRMITLEQWVRDEIGKEAGEGGHLHGASPHRQFVGRGLAVANLLFWAANLFGFLLPVYLPLALSRYYGAAPPTASRAKL